MSGSVGLRWGLRFSISSEFPSDAGALVLGTHFKDQQPRRIFPIALYESFTGKKKKKSDASQRKYPVLLLVEQML